MELELEIEIEVKGIQNTTVWWYSVSMGSEWAKNGRIEPVWMIGRNGIQAIPGTHRSFN